MSGEGPVRYGAWSAERRGVFLGLSVAGWVAVLAGSLPMLAALAGRRWAVAGVWLPVWAVAVAGVAVPVRGRPAARWAVDVLARAAGTVAGWTPWQSAAAAGEAPADLGQAGLPGVLAGVRLYDGPPYGPAGARPVLIANAAARSWAVTARVTHAGIGLADPAERARMGTGLAGLLESAVTGGMITALAVQVRTVPDDGAERARWHAGHARPGGPALAEQVTGRLEQVLAGAAVRHETFVTVVVPEARIARQARQAGGGVDGRGRVLHTVLAGVEQCLLGGVGCTSVTWLDAAALAAAVRTGYAPGDAPAVAAAALAGHPLPAAAAGPTSAPAPPVRWYAHDAWASASCTVLLPDRGAVMGALAPVLAPTVGGERRCLTVFFSPLPAGRADKMIGGQQMTAELAGEVRRRAGFAVRAAQRRDAARIAGQDEQLADGGALVRVAAAAAVTVPAGWPVADYARRLETAITTAGFTPLRLDLAQDSGFAAACIPLGIGLPHRRGER